MLRERDAPLHVEIVAVGGEILKGFVADTNSAFLARELSQRGAVVHRITVVDDRARAITRAVVEALERGAGLVLTVGGLGPTSDDLTMEAVSDALGVPLETHPHAVEHVERALRALRDRGQVETAGMTRTREKLCAIPVGSELLPNAEGVRPGALTRLAAGARVACLPGTPRECRAVWDELLPRIKELDVPVHRAQCEAEAPTADESALQPMLARVREEYPGVWVRTLSRGWSKGRKARGARVVFEAIAKSDREARIAVEGAMQRLLAIAGEGK